MSTIPKALIVCCHCRDRLILAEIVAKCGFTPLIAADTCGAIDILTREPVHLAFCQESLSDSGFKIVIDAATSLALPVIGFSRLADVGRYLECMELGAFDFLVAPYSYSTVASIARSFLNHAPLPYTKGIGREQSLGAKPARTIDSISLRNEVA
jgi:DNA-binding NtrC family response regulator